MKTEEIVVSNISCDGCVRTITKGLSALNGVTSVEVDKVKGIVKVSYHDIARDLVTNKLDELGYPEVTPIKK